MKSTTTLRSILQDAEQSLGTNMSRDWTRVLSRLSHEGVSFLTITLPGFASWLEQSIEVGHALPEITQSFKAPYGSVLPCFLQGATKRIFDHVSGSLLKEPDPKAVKFVRSFCMAFKKLKLQCSEKRTRAAIEKFIATDLALPDEIELDNVVRSVAHVVTTSLRFFLQDDSLPKHGPGATYERLRGNQKYQQRGFYQRWLEVVDYESLYGVSYEGDRPIHVIGLQDERPCRLACVPKTLKSPRLIAVEPVAMQYAQQLCASRLISSMSASPLTRHLDFSDQSVNRNLAMRGSLDGSVATIDLSEASDRVSVALVKEIFASEPMLLEQLLAFRSVKVEIPARAKLPKRVLTLKKYSTSGSALTFPVETLVFFIIALSALVKRDFGSGRRMLGSISHLAQSVSVYGDDIVVPADSCEDVCSSLEALGLKVNRNKTFSKGMFRESCGGDYFGGYDVTPVYIKHDFPSTLSDAEAIVSAVANANLFREKGWKPRLSRSGII